MKDVLGNLKTKAVHSLYSVIFLQILFRCLRLVRDSNDDNGYRSSC